MPFSSMNMGIQAVQAGHLEEGARLLRIALRSDKLSGSLRATALVYLAQTSPDRDFKIKCYNDALVSDPAHEAAHQKLTELYNADLMRMSPPPPAVNIPEPPVALSDSRQNMPAQYTPPRGGTGPLPGSPSGGGPAGTYRFAGIIGGPNGTGSAFFVDRDGLLATSRFAVGGVEEVMVELETGRQTLGRVVRAYPELDLALVQVEQTVTDLMPISVLPRVPEDMPIMAISFDGTTLRGKRRATRKVIPAHWFPTDIPNMDIRDAGGAPILDDRQYVIGMLTRNTSSTSGYVYGLHIGMIRKFVETYRQEKSAAGQGIYCHACGNISRAAAAGGYYCETCGSLMPRADRIVRYWHPQSAAFYYENQRIPCALCNAAAGFHKGRCLRCGREQPRKQFQT